MRKYCKALVNLALALITFLLLIFFLPKLVIFFLPFVAGWVIALLAGPFVRFFEEKLKIKRKVGSAFVIVVVIGLVVLLIYAVGSWLVEQAVGLFGALPEMWSGMESDLEKIGSGMSGIIEKLPGHTKYKLGDLTEQIGEYMGDLISQFSTPTIEAAGHFAKRLPSIFIGVIMALLSAYFFVAERTQLNEWFKKHAPASLQTRYLLIRNSLSKSIGGYFKAQLKIEVWMYLLLVIGLGFMHVNYYGLIALLIAFMDFWPFFGTGTILIPWAILRLLTGDYKVAIGLLVMWGVGQLARQVIQPKIVGDSVGMPPIPTLFLLFIGYKFGSVIGMIIAVPLGMLIYSLYQEGAFDTTKNSLLILMDGINHFRRLNHEDMMVVEEAERQNAEAMQHLDGQK